MIRPLSACSIVRAWEWGQDKHPLDRALFLLSQAYPEMNQAALASLTLGQRNTRLLKLREETLGPIIKGFARCERCHEALEFSVNTVDLLRPEPAQRTYSLEVQDVTITFRLPDSTDLVAVAGMAAADAARCLFIKRCILAAECKGAAVSIEDLPAAVIPTLADAVAEYDPQAEMFFRLECSTCGHIWSGVFDIGSFFWIELEARAKHLLEEVHVLAKTYGWREAEILQMSAPHRQMYLELAT